MGAIGQIVLLCCAVGPLCHCASVPRDANDPYQKAVSSMGVVEPASELEKNILAQLEQFPPNGQKQLGQCTVRVEAPYDAASGRRCRRVHLRCKETKERSRVKLACQSEGKWGVYVPDVFPSEQREDDAR
jgi:hypothetical protein